VGVNCRSNTERAEEVAGAIAEAGGQAMVLARNVAERADVEALFDELESRYGPVLVLVNNAGVTGDGLTAQLEDSEWQRVLDTNLSSAFLTTRRALGPMVRKRFGRIINVTSVSGIRAVPGQANYSASKAGLIGITRSVAAEVARRGVTVNAVAPGFIETDMTHELLKSPEVVGRIPSRRAGRVGEVAAVVRFLASSEASYVTGTVLPVDGGLAA
jgi:3-oxoacyl-[acyl-carrier protein] reductase